MLYGANVAICSELNAKHMNTLWQNVKLRHLSWLFSAMVLDVLLIILFLCCLSKSSLEIK